MFRGEVQLLGLFLSCQRAKQERGKIMSHSEVLSSLSVSVASLSLYPLKPPRVHFLFQRVPPIQ